jgi:hypothetical protein
MTFAKLKLPALLLAAIALPSLQTTPARAEGKLYEIKKTDPKVAAGARGTASVTIAAKGGWHMNAEAPITVKLTPPAGISVPKPKLGRGDLAASTAESARFDIAFDALETGQKVMNAEAHFVICQETACKQVSETVALNIEVTPAVAETTKRTSKRN